MSEDIEALIASIASRSKIKDPTTSAFVKTGAAAASVFAGVVKDTFGDRPEIDILDFGAASGRVAVPLAGMLPHSGFACVDVDADAIEYLRRVAPENCSAEVNGYKPPLRFSDGSFDCVYALSVWSHFPSDLGFEWLRELRRVTRPEALLMISTGGRATLEVWREQNPALWSAVTAEDLERDKFIYREFCNIRQSKTIFPGIAGEGSWGDAAIHPDYIKTKWAELFHVVEVREGGMGGSQDLVILRRP